MPDSNGIHTPAELMDMGYGQRQVSMANGLSRASTALTKVKGDIAGLHTQLADAATAAGGTVDLPVTVDGDTISLAFGDGTVLRIVKRPDGDFDFEKPALPSA